MHSIEQQIYASLAIDGLKAGHHTHASSSGLSASAIERHEQICNRWGEYEPGADFTRAVVHVPVWLDADPPENPSHYVTVLVTYQGRDASGRPGAVLRHVTRIPALRYQGLDFQPFHLLRGRKLLESWTPEMPFPVLEPLQDPTREEDLRGIFPERYPLMRRMLQELLGTRTLHLKSSSDSPAAEETLAELLELVPLSVRRHLSVASFAKKNVADYDLAVVRQEDASLRRSLTALQESEPPELDGPIAAYIGQLFLALENQNWSLAERLIRETELNWLAVEDPPDDQEAPPRDDAPTPRPRETPQQRREIPAELPHRRYSQTKPPRSKLPLVLGGLAVAVVGILLVFLLTRGNDDSGGNDFSELAGIQGADLSLLLTNHEEAITQLFSSGARDFDVRQSMQGATHDFPSKLRRGLAGESARVDADLTRAASEHAWGPATLQVLRQSAERIEDHARRLGSLHKLFAAGDVAALREQFDTGARTFASQPLRGELATAELVDALDYANSLLADAEALEQFRAAAETRDPAVWGGVASTLRDALAATPESLDGPPLVAWSTNIAGSMEQLLEIEAERLADWSSRVPYPLDSMTDGDLGDASRRLRGAVLQLEQAGVPLPHAPARAASFHTALSQSVAPALDGPAAGASAELEQARASAALEQLVALCGAEPDPCAVPEYETHVRRWKLELWRRVGPPDTGAGASLLASAGDDVLPQSGDGLTRMISLLDEMESAPLPAPPAIAAGVRAQMDELGGGLYDDVVANWLSRNERGVVDERGEFDAVYDGLKRSLAALRSGNDGDGPANFRRLRQAARRLRQVDLSQSSGRRVAAARSLLSWMGRAADVTFVEVQVQLLRETDYTGTKRPVANLEVIVSRVGEKAPVIELAYPPMLWGAGVGFPAGVQTPSAGALQADDRLLVQGLDTKANTTWFHFYVDPDPNGHVIANLAQEHVVRIGEAAARAVRESSNLPRLGGTGAEVAKVRFVLQDGWWARYADSLPDLPLRFSREDESDESADLLFPHALASGGRLGRDGNRVAASRAGPDVGLENGTVCAARRRQYCRPVSRALLCLPPDRW